MSLSWILEFSQWDGRDHHKYKGICHRSTALSGWFWLMGILTPLTVNVDRLSPPVRTSDSFTQLDFLKNNCKLNLWTWSCPGCQYRTGESCETFQSSRPCYWTRNTYCTVCHRHARGLNHQWHRHHCQPLPRPMRPYFRHRESPRHTRESTWCRRASWSTRAVWQAVRPVIQILG